VHGPNGSGKTTLLRTLCGLVTPEQGSIRWKNEDIRALGEEFREELLYLGHHGAVKDEFSALENLRIAAQLSGIHCSERECQQALRKIGLSGHEDLPVKVLSQGQRRRVALARLILSRAPLWVLDEPFTALDVSAIATMQTLLKHHLAAAGMVILTTHQEVAVDAASIKRIHLGH